VVSGRRPSLPVFLATSTLLLVPWSVWLASSLPCRYLSEHWGGAAVALATTEAVAVELPVALLCIWVAQRFATPAARERNTLKTTHEQGVMQ
jgi:hypothetical protein